MRAWARLGLTRRLLRRRWRTRTCLRAAASGETPSGSYRPFPLVDLGVQSRRRPCGRGVPRRRAWPRTRRQPTTRRRTPPRQVARGRGCTKLRVALHRRQQCGQSGSRSCVRRSGRAREMGACTAHRRAQAVPARERARGRCPPASSTDRSPVGGAWRPRWERGLRPVPAGRGTPDSQTPAGETAASLLPPARTGARGMGRTHQVVRVRLEHVGPDAARRDQARQVELVDSQVGDVGCARASLGHG